MRIVVLSAEHGPNAVDGPIKGNVPCSETEPPSGFCLADDVPLAQVVLQCGPEEVTINRGLSHRILVYFPAGMHERFRSVPTDAEIVRCVKDRVGFSFRAFITDDPTSLASEDEEPFAPLHSR